MGIEWVVEKTKEFMKEAGFRDYSLNACQNIGEIWEVEWLCGGKIASVFLHSDSAKVVGFKKVKGGLQA